MGANGNHSQPFVASTGVRIIGQPVTLQAMYIPVNAILTCNCPGEGDHTVRILLSEPGTCPSCQRQMVATFNPSSGQVEVAFLTDAEQVPS